MGNTTPDAITYPDVVDRVGEVQSHLSTMASSVQAALTDLRSEYELGFDDIYGVPANVIQNGASVQAISATSFAAIPNLAAITINFARPALVLVTLGAWMVASTGDIRAGIQLSGATVQAANVPNWGQVMYLAGVTGGTVQNSCQKLIQVNAGSTTFTGVAYQSGGGTKQINYSTLQVAPIRWVAAPA